MKVYETIHLSGIKFNPFIEPYQLDTSISNFRVVELYFSFYIQICKQTLKTLIRLCSTASDLGLHCLHMSHKKDARYIWVMNVIHLLKLQVTIFLTCLRY